MARTGVGVAREADCASLWLFSVSLFYLPRFDDWWQQTSIPSLHPLRAALISCLRNLSAATSASSVSSSSRGCSIVIATSGCSPSHFVGMGVHPFLRDFFNSQHRVQFHAPNPPALNAFYAQMIRTAVMDIAQQITRSRPCSSPTASSIDPSAESLVAPSVAVPSSASPSSLLSSAALHADLDSYLSRTVPCPLLAAAHSLSRSSVASSLDFSALHRVQLEMERWCKQQQTVMWSALLGSTPQSRRLGAAQFAPLDPTLRNATDAATDTQRVIAWADLIAAVATGAQETIRAAATDKSQQPLHDTQWTAMAHRHARAIAGGMTART